jgi:hypothetical protein
MLDIVMLSAVHAECHSTVHNGKCHYAGCRPSYLASCLNASAIHRDKTRVQMPAKILPHLKVKC